MIQAVFWDCDNTLVQSEPLHWQKHLDVCREYNITLSADKDRHFIHQSRGVDIYNWLVVEKNLQETQDIYLRKVDDVYQSLMPKIQLEKGVQETLEYLQSKNISQGVISNGRNRPVYAALEGANIIDFFSVIVTYEISPIGKPNPDPCLIGMKMLGEKTGAVYQPENCVFIDDLELGVVAGKAAGMAVIHTPPAFLPAPSQQADYVITKDDSLIALCRQLCGDA